MLEIALFDLEGVLVDTADARRGAVERALRDAGVDVLPALARTLETEGPAVAIEAAFAAARARRPEAAGDARAVRELDETAAELAELRAERYLAERIAGGVALAAGAREAVESLSARLRLGVVTRLRRRDVGYLLELAGLEPAFAVVVTGDDVRRPRPAPDGHRRAVERLARRRPAPGVGASAASVVAFESSAAGVRAARAAGLRVVGVGPGTRPAAALPGVDAAPGDALPGDALIGDAAPEPDTWVPAIAGVTYDSLSALLHPAPDRDR